MAKNTDFVSHKKSKLKNQDGSPKLPLASALFEGEIAVNFAENVETLSIKNESGDVVTFSSDNYYTEKKLGSGFTGENSAVTVTDVIEENEEIIAAALADLDERKLDASAYTELWEASTGENSVVLKNSNNVASGISSVAEGSNTTASGNYSHAEGYYATASGNYGSHAEGSGTIASGNSSHAEGNNTTANGDYSHAEGYDTLASGRNSHAEGQSTSATSISSHAEGYLTKASGDYSHAEGQNTTASGGRSHAEGYYTTASGFYSHAEGASTSATSRYSHTEGFGTIASGDYSHAEGQRTIVNNQSEHASGQYNVSHSATTTFGDSGNTLFSVGNGNYNTPRHNAFEIMQNGDIYIVNKEGRDVRLQDEIGGGGSITVDQVLDDTKSASTNPVSSKAVYKAVTDNELVWTNTYVTLSGTVSSHTENTEIHVTAADKEKLHTHSNKTALDSITDNVGTMAYQNASSYSSATEVNTALGNKANANHNQASNTITAMTEYSIPSVTSAIATTDTLNQAVGKLECALGGIKLEKITQAAYDALVTKDSNTLYIITDN